MAGASGREAGGNAREQIAAAQQCAADALAARAAKEPAVAAVLTAAQRRFAIWRLCASSGCRRAGQCRGDALACAARFWPVACSCLEKMVAAHGEGRPTASAAAEHLAQWSDDGDVLTRVQVRQVMWEDTAERLGIRLPKRSGRQAV